MKVSRGQKIPLVTAASHFVVLWLLLLDFKYRYIVSRYRFEIAISFRPSIWIVISFFSVPHCFIVSSLRMNRVDLGTMLRTSPRGRNYLPKETML